MSCVCVESERVVPPPPSPTLATAIPPNGYHAQTGKNPRDLSMFLVEKGTAGFKLGQKIEDKLGMRASMTAELVFDECKVGISVWGVVSDGENPPGRVRVCTPFCRPTPTKPPTTKQVPAANLVGKEHGAALCMMRNLEIERVGLAAMSVGLARRYVRGWAGVVGGRNGWLNGRKGWWLALTAEVLTSPQHDHDPPPTKKNNRTHTTLY